ncbi:hypothetical protein BDEG_25406 [Batrachochytrium dendrobatidis JEL423]|uniref:Mixed lineage kinase domain-containing protein n=1 Tax=Batrachochytrium dendrobatidis (strain JEL423) TaxID=403673 RepID=A0A177WR96_BATDL|nr:hypothetical protein BDEG_25406 [Batrachochytrium dendrobatidis JEL423]
MASGTQAHHIAVDLQDKLNTVGDEDSTIIKAVTAGVGKLVSVKTQVDDIQGKVKMITDMASKVAGDNPILKQTIQIAQAVFNIGQTIPFVAPVFSILQIIVDVEVKAREADAKCSDLLERINFMVEHLTVIEAIKISFSTEHVIQRMETVLKSAATLIQTYRRQNTLARRLNTGNKDRFVGCCKSIETCSNDLMFSLQIQQTSQLDVLTRAIAIDEQDLAAEAFLKENGGISNIKNHPELVKKFAGEMKLSMDDSVMKDLNSNLTDLINQNSVEMESKLKKGMSEAVVDGLKSLASTLKEIEREELHGCVQCGQTYRESTNAAGSCSFHESQYTEYRGGHVCCGKTDTCKRSKHCSKHHNNYPYAAFFERSTAILGYVDTIDDFVNDEIVDFVEKKHNQSFRVGKLLRTSTGGIDLKEPHLLVCIGYPYSGSIGYHFEIYSSEEIQEIQSKLTDLSESRHIYKINSAPEAFVAGEWLVSTDGNIEGIKLIAKTTTIDDAVVQIVRFNPSTFERIGQVEHVTRGFISYKPSEPYEFPASQSVGNMVPQEPSRPVRTDFKTKCSSNDFPVILLVNSKPPLAANVDRTFMDRDNFTCTVAVFNKHNVPVTIMSASSEYRFIGQSTYKPCFDTVMSETKFPVTIAPRQSAEIQFVAHVPRSEADAAVTGVWWYKSIVARFKPLRIRFTIKDLEDNHASIVIDHVFSPYKKDKPYSNTIASIDFHDWETQRIQSVNVSKGTGDSFSISINDTSYNENELNCLVYKAKKLGITEYDLGNSRDFNDRCVFNSYALVDSVCQRVYGFKLTMTPHASVKEKLFASVLYVPCPDYGSLTVTRPRTYAVEKVVLPELDLIPEPDNVFDDTIDDTVEAPTTTSTVVSAGIAGGNSTVGIDGAAIGAAVGTALSERMSAIEDKLERTASALEDLVAILKHLVATTGNA